VSALKTTALVFASIVVTVPQAVLAQSAGLSKSWAGTWHLNIEKSKFSSPDYTPKKETRTYTLDGSRRLTMRSKMINATGAKVNWGYTANTDGKWYRTSGNPNSDHVALTFVSPRELKSKTTLNGKASARSTITVSADGKQITIGRSVLLAKGGPTNDTLVYERAK
jgi:hypothetical protein